MGISVRKRWALGLAVAVAASVLVGCTRYGATLNRPEDPVVLRGSDLPGLTGTDPMHIVGFAWAGTRWHQVPVQVDQRDWVHPGVIRHQPPSAWHNYADGRPFEILVYTPPTAAGAGYRWWDTYTPPDRDPTFDADDELVFLSDYTGQLAPAEAGHPAGVTAATRRLVTVTDPLDRNQLGYLYLYASPTLTGGGAGTTGVQYDFSLVRGEYRATYRMGDNALPPNATSGANPERTTVTTPAYRLSYSDRWTNDGLGVVVDGVAGPSGLERTMMRTSMENCGRSEDTFNRGGGGFIANISGPVRAIRSYIGSNSGYYNSATDLFYPRRHDTVNELRLHQGAGVAVFDDFRTGVTGLTYRDSSGNVATIDGVPDAVSSSPSLWQMVSSDRGTVLTTRMFDTDIPDYEATTLYRDASPADPPPCTGDVSAWGQNGAHVTGPGGGPLPCTDPTRYPNPTNCLPVPGRDDAYHATATRHRYVTSGEMSVETANAMGARMLAPLEVTVG